MYVYKRTSNKLYTVGYYEPSTLTDNGYTYYEFISESDYTGREDAAQRVHFLNGGN